MLHILLTPMVLAAHAGRWIDTAVLSPFRLGTTAKNVVEEELGCFGVLAYLIYKVSRLIVASWPLLASRWFSGRIAHAIALAAALIGSAWLIVCLYIGALIPILGLQVSYTALMLAPACAWVCLVYVMLADRVRERRAELEAQAGEED